MTKNDPDSPSLAKTAHNETAAFRPDTANDAPRAPAGRPAESWVGTTLGKYQITGVLGQGGMGVVLKGHDPMIERDVAIKVLAEHLSSDTVSLSRFLSEAKAAGKLNHPNAIAIYEICQDGPTNYIVMEYAPGGCLDDRLADGQRYSVLEATLALVDACKGVGAAHASGLIHRDIKPANFMRAADGSIKVADFGLAKTGSDTGRSLTQTGVVVGTPFFMSPEQCEARPLDKRSDIYSLGATYFSLLTSRHPFQGTESVVQLMYMHCHGPIPEPRTVDPTIPEACSRIIARAMAKSAADRYQSTYSMMTDLLAVVAAMSGQTRIALPSEGDFMLPPMPAHSGPVTAAAPAAPSGVAPAAACPPEKKGMQIPAAVAGVLLVALLGLGGYVWRSQTPAHEIPSGPAPLTGEPVKVGVLHSMSGTMANSESVVVDAVLFAIDEINASGGVLGRPVKADVADGRSDNAVFAREAERLLTQDKVAVVFGCWTSASRKTVKPIFEANDHLLVYPVQFEGLETSPAIIYMGAAPNQQILPAVEWAVKTLGKKRFFLVGSDYVFPRAAHAIIKDQLKSLGAEVVGEEFVPLGSAKVDGMVKAIALAKPDMILNTINGDTNNAFFRELRAAGLTPEKTPTMSFSVGEQELRGMNLFEVAGDYAAWTYFESVNTPANLDFVRRFHDKYPQRIVTDPMESAYLGVKLWAQAANEAGTTDAKKVRRAMLTQRVDGPSGLVRLDADTQYSTKTPRIGRIKSDGQFDIVWTAAAPVTPDAYPPSRTAEVWRGFLHDLYTGWGNRWSK